MKKPPNDHTHLWNDLPFEERRRLMPHMIEGQILHLCQARNKFIEGHKRTLAELDGQIKNLMDGLKSRTSRKEHTNG